MSHASVIVVIESTSDVESAVSEQMNPFYEENECFEDGSRWDWYVIGGRFAGSLIGKDIVKREELTDSVIEAHNVERAINLWNQFQSESEKKRRDSFTRSYLYGLSENETKESLIEKYRRNKIHAYAFLKDFRWQENGRMGWFGGNMKTECEINHEHKGTCLHEDEKTGAQIISYKYSEDSWTNNFFDRFILNLPPETLLVNVDYHV